MLILTILHAGEGQVLFFLKLYQAARNARRLAFEWREEAGDAFVDWLLRTGILKRTPVGTLYPCGRKRSGCFRTIIEDPAEDEGTYVAMCTKGECPEVALTAAQVEEYWVSHEDFVRWLRGALRLGGDLVFLDPKVPDTVQLGTLEGPTRWDVLLSLGRDGSTLDTLLAKRQSMVRPCIVLTPSTWTLPRGIREEFPPGGHVVLAVLSDLLRFERDELCVHHSFYDLTHRRGHGANIIGEVQSPEGVRPCTAYEYPTLVARSSEFDLFVDAIGLARGLMASYRTPDGQVCRSELTALEARILVELAQRRTPLAGRDLKALRGASTTDPKSFARLINRARAKVEHSSGRNQWQAFRSAPSLADGPHRYLFSPAHHIRYLILAPIAEEEAPPSSSATG